MAGRTKLQLFQDPALACRKANPAPPKAPRFLAEASRNGNPEADGAILPEMTLEELFHQSLETLPLILRSLGREKRLFPEELEDLRSNIQIKLLEDNYRVLRRWNRRSSFKVYLVTVVYNIWRDLVRGEKGTVRVSAAAKRIGPPAPELEMLLGRHGLKLDQAYRLIKSRFPGLSLGEAEKIAAQINPRLGRRFEGVDVVARRQDLEPTGDKRLELQEMFVKKHEALALMHQILSEFPEHDRLLLVRVHAEGVKFSHIAKSLGGIDQRSLYRRNERLITKLKTDLEEAGIHWEDLSEVLGIDEGCYSLKELRAERPGMMAVTKTCGTPIAAFLDGSLMRDERDLIVWHLSHCSDCFERYIGSARLLGAIDEEEESVLSAAGENRAVEPSLLRGVKVLKKLPQRSRRLVWLLRLLRLAVPILEFIERARVGRRRNF